MTESAMLSIAGALILLLLGIIGYMARQDRQSISVTMAAGFAELKTLVASIEARLRQAEKDCVTWEALESVKLDTKGLDRRVTAVEAKCKAEHGRE